MRAAVAYIVAVLLGIFAVLSWLDGKEKVAAKERQLEVLGHSNDSLKALSAEYWAAHTKPRIDTVRKYVARYIAVRDSIAITDTVIVAAADSAIRECVSLANACEVQREKDAALIESLAIERDSWRKIYETTRYPPWWKTRCGLYLGYGAVKAGPEVYAGPQIGAGCRVFP